MYIFLGILCSLIFGYLLGSISNGVLIGKLFFGIDVRTQGSHNSGGTNTGRVLGKKVGLIVIILDVLKTMIAVWVTLFICRISPIQEALVINPSYYAYLAGFASCIGHTFPCFFSFKGGKAVACLGGLCLATNWLISLIGIVFFLLILLLFKYVSLSSILTSLFVLVLSFIPFIIDFGMNFAMIGDLYYSLLFLAISILVIARHYTNIKRIINKTENKIHWFNNKNK